MKKTIFSIIFTIIIISYITLTEKKQTNSLHQEKKPETFSAAHDKILHEDNQESTNEDIQANTKLLMTPAEDLEEKYVLWSTIFPDKKYMGLLTWFITRP